MLANVIAVLDLADKRVAEIERLYQETLREQEVSDVQALIREAVVGYRSALERATNAIAKEYGIKGRAIYWPNAASPDDLDDAFDKNLPGLRASHPEIAQVWERYQSYQPGYEWITELMRLYRQEQHHDFTPQTRREHLRHVDQDAGGVVSWDPSAVKMSGQVFIHGRAVNPATQMTMNTQRILYVDWLFADSRQSVLGTLQTIRVAIRPMLHDLCSVSGL